MRNLPNPLDVKLLVKVERTDGDSIRIDQLELQVRIGVTDEERAHPQRITISITIWPAAAFEQLKDDLTNTVNYSDLCRVTREFIEERADKLIETLVSALAAHLLAEFRLEAVEVELRKFVLPNTNYVSAIVHRSRSG